jgi:hypothetical protein
LDGEVVAFDGPRTSFRRLQQRMQRHADSRDETDVAVFLYLKFPDSEGYRILATTNTAAVHW